MTDAYHAPEFDRAGRTVSAGFVLPGPDDPSWNRRPPAPDRPDLAALADPRSFPRLARLADAPAPRRPARSPWKGV